MKITEAQADLVFEVMEQADRSTRFWRRSAVVWLLTLALVVFAAWLRDGWATFFGAIASASLVVMWCVWRERYNADRLASQVRCQELRLRIAQEPAK